MENGAAALGNVATEDGRFTAGPDYDTTYEIPNIDEIPEG